MLQPLEILEWKWESISMDFVMGLPKMQAGFDAIRVIIDRLTKSAHFVPFRAIYLLEKLAFIKPSHHKPRSSSLPYPLSPTSLHHPLQTHQSFAVHCHPMPLLPLLSMFCVSLYPSSSTSHFECHSLSYFLAC